MSDLEEALRARCGKQFLSKPVCNLERGHEGPHRAALVEVYRAALDAIAFTELSSSDVDVLRRIARIALAYDAQQETRCDGSGWLRRDPECVKAWRESPDRQLLHGDFVVCDCEPCPGCPACKPCDECDNGILPCPGKVDCGGIHRCPKCGGDAQ